MHKTHKKRELLKAWLQPAVDAYFNFFFYQIKTKISLQSSQISYQITVLKQTETTLSTKVHTQFHS